MITTGLMELGQPYSVYFVFPTLGLSLIGDSVISCCILILVDRYGGIVRLTAHFFCGYHLPGPITPRDPNQSTKLSGLSTPPQSLDSTPNNTLSVYSTVSDENKSEEKGKLEKEQGKEEGKKGKGKQKESEVETSASSSGFVNESDLEDR